MIPDLTKHAWRVFAALIFLAILAIALTIPSQARATPLARCKPRALMTTQTTPPLYLRCKGGLWYAVTKKDYDRLMRAALVVQR